ncbi:MAG: HAMP domain-containing sensor histidine kinase [Salaquimonas sp.]
MPEAPLITDNRSSAFKADLRSLVAELHKVEDVAQSLGTPSIAKPCSIHDQKGALLWVSASLLNLLGHDAEDSMTSLLAESHVQDRVSLGHFLANVAHSHSDANEAIEFRPIRSGRNSTAASWVELTANLIIGSKSGESFVLSTYRNISMAKQNAEAAELLRAEAEDANSAKSKFLANISHELRTPLNAILGFSEMLNSPLIASITAEKRSEYIGLIHDSASHLLTLLNGVLDMSKIENGMYEIFPENFCLSKCLLNTTAIMQGQAAKTSVNLKTIGMDEMPDIVADERAVKQIMINLLSNAIKFSDNNGIVTVKAERRARTVSIRIIDEGVGISAENLENLGKPFFQADSKYDRKYEGTGLGLSVVKGLVELHGGSVVFKSERGKGTTVTLTLPIHGKPGRQVPASSTIEKITTIRPQLSADQDNLRITRNIA